MAERTWNKKGSVEEKRQCSLQKFESLQSAGTTGSLESRLRAAVLRVAPDESARERMIAGVRQEKHGRRTLAFRVPAAVFAVCLLFSLLCITRPGVIGEDVVVYAATEGHGWQKLKEGERIALKMEPLDTGGEGGDFYEDGYPRYYPYICIFQLEVPENCLYDRDFTIIGDDTITERGGRIEWWVAPERPENEGKIMRGALSLWLVSDTVVKDRRERIRGYEVELTKENGKCYAELKLVWESEAYQKLRHGK